MVGHHAVAVPVLDSLARWLQLLTFPVDNAGQGH